MITSQQCSNVCNNNLFRAAKLLLSALSVGLTSAFVIMLQIS